ncbi:MAG TPA: hypothetical protein IAC44_03670 [Candidatus Merdimorpha stercoravium]|uniref:DUF3298 domain-containing protein n=1 Tax=Candidatus Merdimorpha stercoravium TaxID=2840863 RepID=A0A9D1H920_9FLAO|nr:hypothetical protein [Candidatus Merdimorpha stercoravium]
MKKHFIPAALFSLVAALWGCSPQELSYRMEDFSANNPDGDTLSGEAGVRVSLHYPVFSSASPADADRTNRVVDSLVFGAQGSADTLCARFFRRWDAFRNAMQGTPDPSSRQNTEPTEQEAGSDYLSPWYYAASLEVEADYRGCLSLSYTVSTNALDAPGSSLRKYYVLDSRQGTLLSAAEVFSDTLTLRKLLTDTFLEKLEATPGMPLQEQGILLPADGQLPLTDDFRISPLGATFRYDMSAIAPTILPESEIFLPAEVVGPLYRK